MRRMNVLLTVSILALLGMSQAFAASVQFNGTVDDRWSLADNWQGSAKPQAGDDVTLASSVQMDEAVPEMATLVVNSGCTLTTNDRDFTVTGTFLLSGTFSAGASTVIVGGGLDWDQSGAVFNRGTSTIVMNGNGTYNFVSATGDFNNLTIAAAGKTTTMGFWYPYPDIFGVLTLGTGTFNYTGNGWVNVRGTGTPVVNAGATVNAPIRYVCPTSGTVNVAGMTSSQYVVVGEGAVEPNVDVDYVLTGDLSASSITVMNEKWGDCTFTTSGHSVTTTGNLSLGNSSTRYLTMSLGSSTVTVGGSLITANDAAHGQNVVVEMGSAAVSVAGGVTLDGDVTVNAGTSALALNGAAAQSADLNGKTLNAVSVANTAAAVTFPNGFAAASLGIDAGASVNFGAGKTYALTAIDWPGTSANHITLRSTAEGTQWLLNVSGSQTLAYIDVKDSNASGSASPINGINGCIDSGNNLNWLFPISRYWVASAAGNWSDSANWSYISGGEGGASVPTAENDVHFDAGGSGACTVNAAATCKSLELASGFSGSVSLGSQSLTVAEGVALNGGSFNAGTGLITVGGDWAAASGVFAAGASNVTLTGSAGTGATIASGGCAFGDLTVNGSGKAFVLADALAVDGDLAVLSGALDTGASANAAVTVAGLFYLGGTFAANGSTVTVAGNLDWDQAGAVFSRGESTVDLPETSTLYLGSATESFYNLSVAAAGKTTTLHYCYPDVYGVLTLDSGTVNSSGGTWYSLRGVGTPLVNGGATVNLGILYRPLVDGTVSVAGGAYNGTICVGPGATDQHVDVQFEQAADISAANFMVQNVKWGNCTFLTNGHAITTTEGCALGSSGTQKLTVYLGASQVTVGGALSIDQSSLTAIRLDGAVLDAKGNVSVDPGLVLNAGSSILKLTGTGAQSADLGGQKLSTVEVADREGDVTFASSFEANTLKVAAGASVKFAAGQAVALKNLDAQGASGNLVTFRSTTDGTASLLAVSGSSLVRYIDVKDSDASGGAQIRAYPGSVNSGGTTNWVFGAPGVADFTWGEGVGSREILFTALYEDAEGAPLTYEWAFGDEETGSGRQAAHTYAASNTYTVTLTVKDAEETVLGTSQQSIPVQAYYEEVYQPGVTGAFSELDFGSMPSDAPYLANKCISDGSVMRFRNFIGHGQGQVPHDAHVVKATLKLKSTAARDVQDTLFEVAEPWTDGPFSPTWLFNRQARFNWKVNGCGYTDEATKSRFNTPLGVRQINASYAWYSFDVTGVVQKWVNDADLNHGFKLERTGGPGSGAQLFSWPGSGTAGDAPVLEVTWSDLPETAAPRLAITSPLTSGTTPGFIEGTKDPEVDSVTLTVEGVPVATTCTSANKWCAYIARDEADVLDVEVKAADAAGNVTTIDETYIFTVTDFSSEPGSPTVAKGEALLLASSSWPEGAVFVEYDRGDGSAASGNLPVGGTYEAVYGTAGTFTTTATFKDENEAVIEGSTLLMTVNVVGLTYRDGYALGYGHGECYDQDAEYKVKVEPASFKDQVYIVARNADELTATGRTVIDMGVKDRVVLEKRMDPVVELRLGGEDGRIVATPAIRNFLIASTCPIFENPEASAGSMTVMMVPVIPDMQLDVEVWNGTTFDDNTELKTISANDLDANGTKVFRVKRTEAGIPFEIFHRVKTYQEEVWSPPVMCLRDNYLVNLRAGCVAVGGAYLFMREDNNEDGTEQQATENWESHTNGMGGYAAPRALSFLEFGTEGSWHVEVTTGNLQGHSTDKSYSAPAEGGQYQSRANFKSYVRPYEAAAGNYGEVFRWPETGDKAIVDEVGDRAMPYVPGVTFGYQDAIVTIDRPNSPQAKLTFPRKVIVSRLEVDGAVAANPAQPVSDANITPSTRDPFPRVIGELPERTVEYVDVADPENPGQTISNAKPIAIIKVADNQAVWSGNGNLPVTFDASASYDPDAGEGESLTYKWDYEGNGTWVTGTASGSHTYAPRALPYLPKLKVSDVHETESQVVEFQRIVVHAKPTDPEPEAPAVVAEPLGTPVQVTLYTAPYAAVDVKLKLKIDQNETEGMAYVSLSGARKECNTPEYFRMTADEAGYVSRIVYLQGAHYSTIVDGLQLVIEGKEKIESAKDSPNKRFEWETSQEDDDDEPFSCTDRERANVIRVEFVGLNGEVLSSIPVIERDLLWQIGDEDSSGGPGRPPPGSGFGCLQAPFEIELAFTNPGAISSEVLNTIRLTLRSNTDGTVVERELFEDAVGSLHFLNAEQSCVLSIAPTELTPLADTLEVVVQDRTFGALTMSRRSIKETSPNSNVFTSDKVTMELTYAADGQTTAITVHRNDSLLYSGVLNKTGSTDAEEYANLDASVIVIRKTQFGDGQQEDATVLLSGTPAGYSGLAVDLRQPEADTLLFTSSAIVSIAPQHNPADVAPLLPPSNYFRVRVYDVTSTGNDIYQLEVVKGEESIELKNVEVSGTPEGISLKRYVCCNGTVPDEMQGLFASDVVLLDPPPSPLDVKISVKKGTLVKSNRLSLSEAFTRRIYVGKGTPDEQTVAVEVELDKLQSGKTDYLSYEYAEGTNKDAIKDVTFARVSVVDVQGKPNRVSVKYILTFKASDAAEGIASLVVRYKSEFHFAGNPQKNIPAGWREWKPAPVLGTVSINVSTDAALALAIADREDGFAPNNPKDFNLQAPAGRAQWVNNLTGNTMALIENNTVEWYDSGANNDKTKLVIGTKGFDFAIQQDLSFVLSLMIHEAAECRAYKDHPGTILSGAWAVKGVHDCGLAAEVMYLKDTGLSPTTWLAKKKEIEGAWTQNADNEAEILKILQAYRTATAATAQISIETPEQRKATERFAVK